MSKNEAHTKFIYMGDPQCSRISGRECDYSGWESLLLHALKEAGADAEETRENPEGGEQLLVLGGDLVNRGSKTEEWDAFFEAEEGAAKQAGQEHLLMATPVNGAEESTGRFANRFINPGNGPLGHEKEFFSFDWGCCHFIFLDSGYMGNRHKDAYKFLGYWIKADLAVNRKPVTFAVMHHPMYTVGTSFEDDVRAEAMRENYKRLLFRYGVDFILCGHQHVYSRSNAIGDDAEITQIMGVSGTKYFDAWDKSRMALVREFVSTATLFETNGKEIRLRTIDQEGNTLDEYVQDARPPKKRKCGTCEKFDVCKGTGEYEKLEAEELARQMGDPLKPANQEGITIRGIRKDRAEDKTEICAHFSDTMLDAFEWIDVEYSTMQRGKLRFETKHGFRLSELLEKAGVSASDEAVLLLTDSRGRQRALPLADIMKGEYFTENCSQGNNGQAADHSVPALIFREDGGYRIAYGQQSASHYNGRGWARDIREIEVL